MGFDGGGRGLWSPLAMGLDDDDDAIGRLG